LPLGLRQRHRRLAAGAEQVERDEARRRLRRELGDARRRGVDALLQRVEVEPVRRRDDDLAVEHATFRQRVVQRPLELGEERFSGFRSRLCSRVCSAVQKTIALKPSHFGSNRKPGSLGSASALLASIGMMDVGRAEDDMGRLEHWMCETTRMDRPRWVADWRRPGRSAAGPFAAHRRRRPTQSEPTAPRIGERERRPHGLRRTRHLQTSKGRAP
jgi:hypothetical protein